MRVLGLILLLGLGPARALAAEAGAGCVSLAAVEVDAAGLLSAARRDALAAPWLGRCIDDALVQGLLRAVAADLVERGYVTSRPYLPAQDVADGVVDIAILPGRIEAIVDAGTGEPSRRLAGAFLGVGEILNLRELESALETVERPASVEAGFDIRPGAGPGGSIVAVALSEARPLAAELSVNARSETDSGLGLRLDWDNPLALNDSLNLGVNQGDSVAGYQSNRSAEIAYGIGLGGLLLELSLTDIEFEQRIQGINDSFLSAGETRLQRLRVGGAAWRGRRARLELALALELKNTRNFFDDEPIDVSSYRTSQLQFEVGTRWDSARGRAALAVTWHRGLDDFGARDDAYYTRGDSETHAARLQFDKTTVDLSLDR